MLLNYTKLLCIKKKWIIVGGSTGGGGWWWTPGFIFICLVLVFIKMYHFGPARFPFYLTGPVWSWPLLKCISSVRSIKTRTVQSSSLHILYSCIFVVNLWSTLLSMKFPLWCWELWVDRQHTRRREWEIEE